MTLHFDLLHVLTISLLQPVKKKYPDTVEVAIRLLPEACRLALNSTVCNETTLFNTEFWPFFDVIQAELDKSSIRVNGDRPWFKLEYVACV